MAQSNDPNEAPLIKANYLSDAHDFKVMSAGIRHVRRIFESLPIADHTVTELDPGEDCVNDEDLEQFARHKGTTLYHPVGTCKMGIDSMAVVDPRLRVHGIASLRIADASIMPTLTTGNTNAPTIMIGEKAAEMIIEDQ